MRYKGKLTQWDDDKGFGFVEPIGGGPRAFVHIQAFDRKPRRPLVGDMLLYETSQDDQGRWQAVHVCFSNHKIESQQQAPAMNRLQRFGIMGFFGCLSVWSFQQRLPWLLPWSVVVLSSLTYFVYALDKRAAQQGQWRTSEKTLHLWSLFGGWPGALVAQHRLRHKSSKAAFRGVFWLTVIIHVLMVNYLVWSSQGQQWVAVMLQWSWF